MIGKILSAQATKGIDTCTIGNRLSISGQKLNLNARVDPNRVILPEGYKEKAIDLIRKTFEGYQVNYSKPRLVAIGLSGGLDSSTALTAAVQALGKDKVRAVLFSHKYMTLGEKEDREAAEYMIDHLGVRVEERDISVLVEGHWAFTQEAKKYGSFLDNLLKAEGLVRARASAMESYTSIENALTIDTTNMTELVLGNITTGAYMGMVEIFEDLLKCEVYELARQLGVPSKIREQSKRVSEMDSTNEKMFGTSFWLLDPIVYRFLLQKPAEVTARELGHPLDWINKLYQRMDSTRFRYSAAGPVSRIGDFVEKDWDNKALNIPWVNGMQGHWNHHDQKLIKDLLEKRREYMP